MGSASAKYDREQELERQRIAECNRALAEKQARENQPGNESELTPDAPPPMPAGDSRPLVAGPPATEDRHRAHLISAWEHRPGTSDFQRKQAAAERQAALAAEHESLVRGETEPTGYTAKSGTGIGGVVGLPNTYVPSDPYPR